jgi:3-oxoacyl-[acyl-carrier protein] reductase
VNGEVVVVTGAARGLGRAYALGLAGEGYAVVVADLADPEPVVDEIESAGGTALGVGVDVADPDSARELADRTLERFGRIDVLVNNAGYMTAIVKQPFEDISPQEWDHCMAVNVRGTWLCCRAVVPAMKRQRSGKIVNTSSATVPSGVPGFLHYVSSKAAIIGLTRALALEVGQHGINVNTLVPEYIPHDLEYAQDLPQIDAKVVAQRVFKRTQVPEDMVGAAVFLCSQRADFITGQSLLVNGGTQFQ